MREHKQNPLTDTGGKKRKPTQKWQRKTRGGRETKRKQPDEGDSPKTTTGEKQTKRTGKHRLGGSQKWQRRRRRGRRKLADTRENKRNSTQR